MSTYLIPEPHSLSVWPGRPSLLFSRREWSPSDSRRNILSMPKDSVVFYLLVSPQVCNNEATCTCDATWAGTDCSMHDPPKEPPVIEDPGPKGSSFLLSLKIYETQSTVPYTHLPVHIHLNARPLQSHFQTTSKHHSFLVVPYFHTGTFPVNFYKHWCIYFFFLNGAISDIFSVESPLFPLHSERGHKQADRGSGRDHSGPGGDFWRHRVGNRVSTS